MENFDKKREQQVWKRVRGNSPPSQRQDLRALHLAVLENQAAYRRLTPALAGRLRDQAQALLTDSQAEAATLRGLHFLSTGAALAVKPQSPPPGSPVKLLVGCYHRTYRALGEYTARSAQAEYGAVFQELARQAQGQCASLARLLGDLADNAR